MQSMEYDFSRKDNSNDSLFYQTDRMVSHLDATALETVEQVIGTLVVEEGPVILDLMASWDSHLPEHLKPSRVVGLGLNENELKANQALDEYVIHDLNQNPVLPFDPDTFDAVICTVSVDYLIRPDVVFRSVSRVLKPGGLFLVIFSTRWFEGKVTMAWRDSTEADRVWMVKDWFQHAALFEEPRVFVSKGLARPADDKYAELGIPSDPIYAVYADRIGGDPARGPRPVVRRTVERPSREEIERRSAEVKDTHVCPYCGGRMLKWEVPQTPFTEWDNEYMYVCFNDACPYLLGGWEEMGRQGNYGVSYRMMYNPVMDHLMPVAVPSLKTMRDGILDE